MKKYKIPKSVARRLVENGQKQKNTANKFKWAEQSCACGHDVTLPWWCPYLVTAVTMVIRVSYVISPRSWWILHPDEVYQTVEVAFSEISGYGFRSYEYLPAPTNTSVPIETQALESGMFGLRSFLLPYIFATVLRIVRTAGIPNNTFMICRVFNTLVTSTLPLAVYKLVYSIYPCRLVALLSCALAASSLHLAVFGTHPLVNSFTATFIIIATNMCLNVGSTSSWNSSHKPCITGLVHPDKQCSDFNGNLLHSKQKISSNLKDRNHDAIIADDAILTNGEISKHSDLVIRKSKLSEQKDTHSDLNPSLDVKRPRKQTSICWEPFVGGAIAGITCYVRPDVLLFFTLTYFPLTLAMETTWHRKLVTLVTVIFGGVSAVFICVADDFYHYGTFVFSPIQWFTFNVVSQKASFIFSSENSHTFINTFLEDKVGLVLNISGLVIILSVPFVQVLQRLNNKPVYALAFSHILLLFVYSMVGHKESRFIHNLFILMAILSAITLHYVIIILQSIGITRSHIKLLTSMFLFICAIHSYQNFPSIENNTASDWSYKDPEQSRDINSCLNFLRNQNDVTGVMVNASVYNIGGYAILGHDVQVLVRVHHEFHLYERKLKNRLGDDNRIRVLTDFSDFIDIDNHLYVYTVIRESNLNYVVTQSIYGSQMKLHGFENVFTFGKHSVYSKRLRQINIQRTIKSETIENADILEYEANWLITNSLYSKAIWRINTALEINRKLRKVSRVRLYQLLMVCYGKMKQWDYVIHYQDECFSIYGRETCVRQHDKIIRHDDYHRFN